VVSEDVAIESEEETEASSGTALVTGNQILSRNRRISPFHLNPENELEYPIINKAIK
jgi:hypothetical protein